MKKIFRVLLVALLCVSLPSFATNGGSTPLTTMASGVDFTDVMGGALVLAGGLVTVYLLIKGVRTIFGMLKR